VPLFAPLRGLRARPDGAGDVAALPYDVMSRAEAIAMASGRPHCFLHVSRPDIDLPEGADPDGPDALALAARALDRLRADGLLVRDPDPAFHAYRLSGTVGGRPVRQTGVIGLADVAAYDAGRIVQHERTRPAKQAGRAAHMEALGAQTGPAFLVHPPDAGIRAALAEVCAAPAGTDLVGPGGIRHELWPITEPRAIGALVGAFEALDRLYIADGHHRSAAASMVHARLGTPASAGFLAVAFPADEVTILPYHRVVRAPDGLTPEALVAATAERFTVQAADGPVTPAAPGRFGLYCAGRWWRLEAPAALRTADADPAEQLDVALLQRHLLGPVLGIADPRTDARIGFVGGVRPVAELERAVRREGWTAAFTLHPTTIGDLVGVADAGGIMPPKSTWFEPKLLDGLVSHVLD
jgi:uncharacterized protein (DUF1015 family)